MPNHSTKYNKKLNPAFHVLPSALTDAQNKNRIIADVKK